MSVWREQTHDTAENEGHADFLVTVGKKMTELSIFISLGKNEKLDFL